MAEIIRIASMGKTSIDEISEILSGRPFVRGSEVISITELAKSFGFLEINDNEIKIRQEGLDFMKYVSSYADDLVNFKQDSKLAASNQELTADLHKIQSEFDNKEVKEIIKKVLDISGKIAENSPDFESFETLVTVTLPPNKPIPGELKGKVVSNYDAERKVIVDCKEKIIIATPFIDPTTFQLLLRESVLGKIDCVIITSDEDRIKKNRYALQKLKTIISNNFRDGKILYLRKDDIIAHAKMWLSEKSVLISSANVMSNSQTNNFELGVYTDNIAVIQSCHTLLNKIIPLCEEI